MKFKYCLFFLFTLFTLYSYSQKNNDAFIKLTEPLTENNPIAQSQKFIIGSTCKSCSLSINGQAVKVYPTGAFAYELNLLPGSSSFEIIALSTSGKKAIKKINYNLTFPSPEKPTTAIAIEKIQTFPEGNLWLMPGDIISFKVKAKTGCSVFAAGNTLLNEMPDSVTKGLKGIYQGTYVVKSSDTFINKKLPITLISSDSNQITKETSSTFTVMNSMMSDVYITKGRLAHLEYGLGDDRLGGAKIGYIDSLIPLKITGKVGSHFKVRLAGSRTAYIPDELVNPLPVGTFTPSSLTGKINVYHDSNSDVVNIQLFSKLPYQTFHQIDPSQIVVDIFGATNNTNWISQLENLQEIKNVTYEQRADEIFRVYISLKHAQHWGHRIYYSGNNLVIKIKPQPQSLALNDLTIAIDAGHGGTNTGAGGPTSVLEKNITLPIALKLKAVFEKEGAKVIMTRTNETFFDNKKRILFYRDSTPDLLFSIHLNSSEDPIHISGTSTFYRYEGFKNLGDSIHRRILELGLKDCGNNGSFNFMLNSPTEYPNALIETLYLSNPEEEMKILDETFQQQLAEKILLGVKGFLNGCQ